MAGIEWCKSQKKGIRLCPPSPIIARDYLRKADGSLAMMQSSPPGEWKVVGAYYACYEALYALLQKAGIICEIHDCTLALMPYFGFEKTEIEFLSWLKTQRINAQYYIDRPFSEPEVRQVQEFVLLCKQKCEEIDVEGIRKEVT